MPKKLYCERRATPTPRAEPYIDKLKRAEG